MFFVQELADIGFRQQDILLINISPIFAAVGGMVSIFITYTDYSRVPEDAQKVKSIDHAMELTSWIMSRLFIAFVAGLVLAFLMVSSLEVAPTSVAKMFVLAIFAGLLAPSIFLTQQKAAIAKLNALLRS